MTNIPIMLTIIAIGSTIACYQLFALLQRKLNKVWLNPMLLTIIVFIVCLQLFETKFSTYFDATYALHSLLEPAVVALGFPLYQHLPTIIKRWKSIVSLLSLGAFLVISVSYIMTEMMIGLSSIAVSLSLKSVTTPIGIALTEQLNGNNAITAFAIILAGLFGALLGPPWLNLINVRSAKAQGLAIGAASHALGTATISKLSYEHAAYSSLSLIFSALVTAIFSPFIIGFLTSML
jgi:putative effector of murein hydrolase